MGAAEGSGAPLALTSPWEVELLGEMPQPAWAAAGAGAVCSLPSSSICLCHTARFKECDLWFCAQSPDEDLWLRLAWMRAAQGQCCWRVQRRGSRSAKINSAQRDGGQAGAQRAARMGRQGAERGWEEGGETFLCLRVLNRILECSASYPAPLSLCMGTSCLPWGWRLGFLWLGNFLKHRILVVCQGTKLVLGLPGPWWDDLVGSLPCQPGYAHSCRWSDEEHPQQINEPRGSYLCATRISELLPSTPSFGGWAIDQWK